MELEARLTQLEEKLSFAEDQVDALNRTVFRQQQQIDQLVFELRSLRQQMQSSVPGDKWTLRDEIPPHY